MDHLSLRGFDKELERRLRELARSENVSLNKAALLLLRRGAGLVESSQSSTAVANTMSWYSRTNASNRSASVIAGSDTCGHWWTNPGARRKLQMLN